VRAAAMVDPNTAATLTVDQIWHLCDDLTVAHGDLLPPSLRSRSDVAAGAAPNLARDIAN
jgi:alpha-galactosidase